MKYCLLAFTIAMLIGSNAAHAYVLTSYFSGSRVAQLDRSTGATLNDSFISGFANPHGILQPTGDDIYVADWHNDYISIHDSSSGAFVGSINDAGGNLDNPVYMRVGPDGALWVTSQTNNRINRYDLTNGNTLTPLVTNNLNGPSGFAFSPDFSQLFVANRGGGSGFVNVFNLNNAGALSVATHDATLASFGSDAFGIQYSNQDDMLYVGNASGGLQLMHPTTGASSVAATGSFVVGVELGEDGYVYFADFLTGELRRHLIGGGQGSDLYATVANSGPNFFNLDIVPEPSVYAFLLSAFALVVTFKRRQ